MLRVMLVDASDAYFALGATGYAFVRGKLALLLVMLLLAKQLDIKLGQVNQFGSLTSAFTFYLTLGYFATACGASTHSGSSTDYFTASPSPATGEDAVFLDGTIQSGTRSTSYASYYNSQKHNIYRQVKSITLHRQVKSTTSGITHCEGHPSSSPYPGCRSVVQ